MSKNTASQSNLFEFSPDQEEAAKSSVHPLVHFGTSTWAYPGWKGIVYSKQHKNSTEYLREYVRDKRFSTVGADFTFYQPPNPQTLKTWNEFLPPGFRIVFKVWDEITVDRFGKQDEKNNPKRPSGSANPHYLDQAFFEDVFLERFKEGDFVERIGSLAFEFRSSTARNPKAFLEKLEKFLIGLPPGYPYSVEVREPKLLTNEYFSILKQANVSHVFNHWDRMPPLSEQMERSELTGPAVVSRILTPLKTPYAVAKKQFAPYNRLKPENVLPQMRRDAVELCLEAIRHRLPGYILVNNRSEGCAPLTIQALEEMLQTASALKEGKSGV